MVVYSDFSHSEADDIRSALTERTRAIMPVHLYGQPANLPYDHGAFPVTERSANRIVSLPMWPEMQAEQVDEVCAAVREFYAAVDFDSTSENSHRSPIHKS